MDFIEFIVLKITGHYKSIILYLQNKNDANKKILLDVEIKSKKILRTIIMFVIMIYIDLKTSTQFTLA
jgi:guanylate kinase